MPKITVEGVHYDTDTARRVGRDDCYDETLYRMPLFDYFLVQHDGGFIPQTPMSALKWAALGGCTTDEIGREWPFLDPILLKGGPA